jgi:hypothetical protein
VGAPLNRFSVFPAFFSARPNMRSPQCVLCVAPQFWSGSPPGGFSVGAVLLGAVQCEKECKKARKCLKVTLS